METTERIAYTVKEAAAALGVSEWMIREEIRTGKIECIRMGSRILIPRVVLGGVVKRVCSRSSLPGVGKWPGMTPLSWHNGSPLRATA